MQLGPVFQRVARRDHLGRAGQLQIAPGQQQHRLVHVVDGVIADRDIGGGEDADIAVRFQPVDLVAAGLGVAGLGVDRGGHHPIRLDGFWRRCALRLRLGAVPRGQPVGGDGDIAALRARIATRDHHFFGLLPVDAVTRGDRHRPALRHVQRLGDRRERQACNHRQRQQPHSGPACNAHREAPFRTSRAGPVNWIAAPLSVNRKPCASRVPNGPST